MNVTRDPVSGILLPNNGREWRAVLDAAGLRHMPTPVAIYGPGTEWHARKPPDQRTPRQRTRDRRRRRGRP